MRSRSHGRASSLTRPLALDPRGPFPALVLGHGYIDPDVYVNGQGLRREQDYLARHGYVVLHTDYRNHAQSDDDPDSDLELRLGYVEEGEGHAFAAAWPRSMRRTDAFFTEHLKAG